MAASLRGFCRATPVCGGAPASHYYLRLAFLKNGQNGSVPGLRFWDSRVEDFQRELARMSNEKNTPEFVNSKSPAEIQKLEDQKMLNRVANEAAEQGGTTERLYDQSHDIFTK
jgi:hypothetical protein